MVSSDSYGIVKFVTDSVSQGKSLSFIVGGLVVLVGIAAVIHKLSE